MTKGLSRILLSILFSLFLSPSFTHANQDFSTSAKQAILIDVETWTTLFEKDADELMDPSSMSKLMLIYIVLEKLKDGSLKPDQMLPVSKKAWKMMGSKMWVMVDTTISVLDLLKGVIIVSGNDACIVLAEGISGTEEGFVELMNAKAKEIGLEKSHFANCHGWEHKDHKMTARELALLASKIISEFPDHYSLFKEKEFTWSKIKQPNRNPLLYIEKAADGLKTGNTDAGGYGLVASTERDGRRLIMVMNGLPSDRIRAQETERFMEWGFREFDIYRMAKPGQQLGEADVWLGKFPTVKLYSKDALTLTLPKKASSLLKAAVRYEGPLPAPIKKDQQLAMLEVTIPGWPSHSYPLYAAEDVAKQGFITRTWAALKYLVIGADSPNRPQEAQ